MVEMIYTGVHAREICLQNGQVLIVSKDQKFEVSENDYESLKLQQNFKKSISLKNKVGE